VFTVEMLGEEIAKRVTSRTHNGTCPDLIRELVTKFLTAVMQLTRYYLYSPVESKRCNRNKYDVLRSILIYLDHAWGN
jgi:hypothetical protein